jgi:hypothetical protein
MDTDVKAALLVHRQDGSIMKFKEFRTGLYYFDASIKRNLTSTSITGYCFVQTVQQNKSMFHQREIEGADKARDLYAKLG